ncbi:type II toxin-antitoxin system Phd/YefM family antitoxin [Asticcacaulis sp. AND118]|uniref:type II toxin-antitoxin system Phd/YefM family antitoxin n=1 Tax=Asticcacaulis sp. AND118 TaxID=2840468 RepID=UPI001CFFAE69|nr:type II toxin-antitoxin system Phd/YefM family antitoxin [Asticcacaulis sp. AND118]UDF05452.1 type II toxin-antitoxin system Phd/YefM family antitoxin [Asticcacaulis sp. AND118]
MSTFSSREFNQDVGGAKRAALSEPVFITDRGKPTHVLMSFDAYRAMSGQTETLVDLLALTEGVSIDLDAARAGDGWDRQGGA